MSNIFDFGPIADVAEKLAKNAVNNVVGTDEDKPNIQLPDKVVENVRNTWNNLVNANQAQQPQAAQQSRQISSTSQNSNVFKSSADNRRNQELKDLNDNVITTVSGDKRPVEIASSIIIPSSSSVMTRPAPSPTDTLARQVQDEQHELNPQIESQNSQKSVDDLQKDLKAYQDKQYAFDNGIEKLLLLNQYGQLGMSPNDPIVQDALANSKPSSMAQDMSRRITDGNGNLEMNPLKWNLLGANSQTQAPDAARGLYDRVFAQDEQFDGPVMKSTWRTTELNPMTSPESIRNDLIASGIDRNDPMFDYFVEQASNKQMVDPNLIDDGQSAESREAAFMTGDQYLKYRQAGLPGRPIDQINPDHNEIYSKQDEMEKYGFIPYLTSQESVDKFHETTSPHSVANYFNDLADARRNATDYTIKIDGEEYSGKDWDRNVRLWKQRMANAKYDYKYENPDEYDIPQNLVLSDGDKILDVAKKAPIDREQLEDGRIVVKFDDDPSGWWVFDDEEDYKKNFKFVDAEDEDNSYIAAWLPIEPLTLDSGQKVRADKVEKIDQDYDNYVDYSGHIGPVTIPNLAKPAPDGILENPSDFVPWFTDMTLSSSPYFSTKLAGTKGAAEAFASAQGMRPGRQGRDGTYNLVSERPDFNDVASAAGGSAIMPITEHLWGPLGTTLTKTGPTRWVLDRIPGTTDRMLDSIPAKWATGASDEGVEEIFGNIVEELINNGQGGWYADDVYQTDDEGHVLTDSNGRPIPMVDRQGRVIKRDTDPITTTRNFILDGPEAYAGGAVLGGVLGAGRIPEYKMEQQIEQAKSMRNKPTEIDFNALAKTRSFTDAERRRYDNGR